MKTMRSLGCADACWFRRSVLRGMVYAVGEAKLGFEKERRLQKESLRLWMKRFPLPARYRSSASLLNRQAGYLSCLSREREGEDLEKVGDGVQRLGSLKRESTCPCFSLHHLADLGASECGIIARAESPG
jgi:hypothetical protein